MKFTGPRRLSWRELTGYFLTFSLAVPTVVTMAASPSAVAAPASDVAANGPERTVKFHDGVVVPALGQGSARLGQGRHPEAVEEEALREGVSLGMTLIDTAEIYGNGDAEKLIGRVIAGRREQVFLVSKVWPTHVAGTELKGLARGVSRALGQTISTFTCCIGQTGSPTFRASWRPLRTCVRRARYAPGASPISMSATWRGLLAFRMAMAAQPIKSLTVSVTGPLNMTCCHGAHSTQYQSWPTRHSGERIARYCVTPCSRVLVQHMVVRQPPSPWPGPLGAVKSSQFLNLAMSHT